VQYLCIPQLGKPLATSQLAKIQAKIDKDVEKAEKRFGDKFDKEQFLNTNDRALKRKSEITEISSRLYKAMDSENLSDIKTLIEDLQIACPVSGSKNWTDVRQFNLMFSTQIGSVILERKKNEVALCSWH
jgi:glycyl-tRNA synthetase